MPGAQQFAFTAEAYLWRPATPSSSARRVSLGRVVDGALRVDRQWTPFIQATLTLAIDELAPGPAPSLRQLIPELEPIDPTDRARVVVPRVDLVLTRTAGPAPALAHLPGATLGARPGATLGARTTTARTTSAYGSPLPSQVLTVRRLVVHACVVDDDEGTVTIDVAGEDLFLDDDTILGDVEELASWTNPGDPAWPIGRFIETILSSRGYTNVRTSTDVAPATHPQAPIEFLSGHRLREGLDALCIAAEVRPYVDVNGEWHLRSLAQYQAGPVPLTHPAERPQRTRTEAARAGDWGHSLIRTIRWPYIDGRNDTVQVEPLARAPGRRVLSVSTDSPFGADSGWGTVPARPSATLVARARARARLARFDLPFRPEWVTGIGTTVGVDRHGAELVPNRGLDSGAAGWTRSSAGALVRAGGTWELTSTPTVPQPFAMAGPSWSWAHASEELVLEYTTATEIFPAGSAGVLRVDLIMFTETGAVGLVIALPTVTITSSPVPTRRTVTVATRPGPYPHAGRMGLRARLEPSTTSPGLRMTVADITLRRSTETRRLGGLLASSSTDLATGWTTLETES